MLSTNFRQSLGSSPNLAAALASLESDGYSVLHDVRVGISTIELLVVGPTGIFPAQTRRRRPPARPSRRARNARVGRRADIVNQVLANEVELRMRLRRTHPADPVHPALVLTAGRLRLGRLQIDRATVMEASDLPAFVRSRPEVMTRTEIAAVLAALEAELPSDPMPAGLWEDEPVAL